MGIENYLSVQELERFVQQLPPEHRAEVYRIAETFYSIGSANGAFVTAMGMLKVLAGEKTPTEDKCSEWQNYLSRRARELKVETNKPQL